MTYKPCECPVAGYCKRYKTDMGQGKWKLCQKIEKYRMLFDEIAGNEDFGMWKTAKKGNIPAGVPRQVKTKIGTKTLLNEEQRKQVVKEHRQVEEAVEELKNIKESEGLGDSVERILTKFGITKSLMEKVMKRTCKCDDRKAFLNKLIPYTKINDK